jgi:methyl-accepting chemotaxis protein
MKRWRELWRSNILRILLLVLLFLSLVPLLVLGLVFLLGSLLDNQSLMPWALGVVFLLTAGGIVAAAYYLYRFLARPLLQLRDVAGQVSMGDYSQDVTRLIGPRRDEIGQFSEAFNLMVTMIEARETNLRAQVQRLQIEIDEARKAQQVSEITESDYFKELRKKAQSIRQSRQEKKAESQD